MTLLTTTADLAERKLRQDLHRASPGEVLKVRPADPRRYYVDEIIRARIRRIIHSPEVEE